MISGLILSIGSLFFMTLLLVVYFSKHRFLSIRNKLYRYMILVVIFLIISEIISSVVVYFGTSNILKLTLYRIHWSTGIIWFALLYFYSISFIKDIKSDNLFQFINHEKRTKIMNILFIIFFLVYFIIPFDNIDLYYISYLPGYAAYYVLIFCSFVVFMIVIYLLRVGKEIDKRKKISVSLMIVELIIVFSFQIFFQNIAFEAIGASIQMFFLYFAIENPDLELISELQILKDDIEKSNKAKSDFLSNMSHEIRSPMNAIVGFSQTLLNEKNFDEESARNDIKHIESASNSLLEIINNILDISKIESGKETLEMKEYSLRNIIMELSSIIDARLGTKPIKLITDIDSNIPSKLYGDSTKIFQILLNILTNSAKYTEVGKIKLSINAVMDNENCNLKFKISDTGYGIKKEDFDKLFSKFSRLDIATSKEIEGTGLGLVITKRYVDLMDGDIWFESEFEVGTTFYVTLNQKIIDRTPIGTIYNIEKPEKLIDDIDCSNYKILIVDDNKLNIKVASRLLSAYKFNIDTANSGKECIYKFKGGTEYDMIFLDHMMPEMDGIETLHILRKLDDYKVPPVVALTANAITGMKEMYLKEGFDEYLSKPINITELNKLIKKYFSK